jgi:hypothetical protein
MIKISRNKPMSPDFKRITFRALLWSIPGKIAPLIKNFLEYNCNELYHIPAFLEGKSPPLFYRRLRAATLSALFFA